MRRINWDLHLRVIHDDLDRILEYIDRLEGASEGENRALLARISEDERTLTAEERPWWRTEMYGSQLTETAEAIPQMMWHAAFVTLFSYVEMTLAGQARRHYRKVAHFAPELLPDKLKGEPPDLRYLAGPIRYWEAWGFAFPNDDDLWNEIDMFRKIRNRIAHAGGMLDDARETVEIVRYVEARQRRRGPLPGTLSVGPIGFFSDKTITMSAAFCREAVESVRQFFDGFVPKLP